MSSVLIYLLCVSVLTGCFTAWVWCFVNKWEVSEDCTISQWVQIHAPKKVGEMMRCPFCFNWWAAWVVMVPAILVTGDWVWTVVPFLSTAIGRALSN